MSSTNWKLPSSALLGASGQQCYGHSHMTPCSLAPPVLGKDGPYCDSPLPNEESGKEGTDQGGSPVLVAFSQEKCQMPTSAAQCDGLFLPVVQSRSGLPLACVKP